MRALVKLFEFYATSAALPRQLLSVFRPVVETIRASA